MSRKKQFEPPQRSVLSELKRLLSSFVAFAAAIVILAIQGSIRPNGMVGYVGLGIVTASIPLGIVAYILFHKVLESDSVPSIGYKVADRLSSAALLSIFAGFIFILQDFNPLLCWILIISLVVSVLILERTVKAWEKAINKEASKSEESTE